MDVADGSFLVNEHVAQKRPLILTTKLYTPRTHATLVTRPHLTKQLDTCLHCQLTIVSAPAGFGKTTLVAEWAKEKKNAGRRFAWVSFDDNDNDPVRFLTYFIAGLKNSGADWGEVALDWLELFTKSPIEAVLSEVINDVAALPHNINLILDDFHLIREPAIHEAFAFLLDNQPPNLHLIIISRADPPWPLARLRARRELNEIRARDLRFSVAETAVFLNDTMKLCLTPEEVIALENRTEGWIAGLQMAALSMRGGKDAASFIDAFTGTHRYILDYLIEEVLERQTPEIQEFLLQTSVLERMNASLCDALLNRSDSQSVLVQLELDNLFLIALDDERRWYRYHHLFADLLHSRLGQTSPHQAAALHRQAGKWYEENGLLNEAVRHALWAGDFDQVAHLIGKNALAMAYHGELRTLVSWLEKLPAEKVQSKPQLCIAYAWALGFSGRLQDVEPWLQKAEHAISAVKPRQDVGDRDDRIQYLASQISAARAYAAGFDDDISRVAIMAREALEGLPQENVMTRGLMAAMLGIGLRLIGDYEESVHAFEEAVTLSQKAGDTHLLLDVLWERSVLEFSQGRLNRVMETCHQACRFADDYTSRSGRRLPILGYIYERMSTVLCERNDLESAVRYAREAITLCQKWGNADALVNSNFCLARALLAKGELNNALDVVQGISHLVPNLGKWYILASKVLKIQIRFLLGDMTAVTHWAEQAGPSSEDEVNLQNSSVYLLLAKFLIAQDKPQEALSLLSRLLEVAEASGAMVIVVQVLARQAVALQLVGEPVSALNALERALHWAEPEDFVRTFINEGIPMQALLRQVAARGYNRAYASKLLAAFPDEFEIETPTATVSQSSLIEPLSERELDVLRLLTTHLSGTEIAEELFIAASTVRSHIKNIYSKLNVHSRAEAVLRAEELNLL